MPNTKVSALTAQTAAGLASTDLALVVDVSDTSMGAGGTDKKITLGTLFDFFHPVGSYYFNGAVTTSPVTLFGSSGTWVAVAGVGIMGYDAGQTEFNTLLKTGGEKTHLLTGAESGEKGHNHTQDPHNHFAYNYNQGQSIVRADGNGSGQAGGGTIGSTTATNQAVATSDASQAHNNLQPYEVAAMWRRTA